MNDANSNPTTSGFMDCGKCDGRGKIDAFGHYANGTCFDCGGTGRISCEKLSETEWAKRLANMAGYDAEHAMAIASDGYDTAFYAARVARQLLSVGTVLAREVLNHVGAGRFWDVAGHEWGQLDLETARGLRAEIIAAGRAAKAAA